MPPVRAKAARLPPRPASTWDVKPDPIPESDIAGTTDVDVVVIGAGNAGVAAACSAVEEGLKGDGH